MKTEGREKSSQDKTQPVPNSGSLDMGRMWIPVFVLVNLVLTGEAAQYFTEQPSDLRVIRGRTAVLKCSVGDRKGNVQWTKDSFPLGYNHSIPAYARYSISSSHDDQFDLMIVNSDLEDDAVYECQVSPRGGDSLLRAEATLTVLVPCERPRILNDNNASKLEVSHTKKTIELVCEARNGRPAATITWYRRGLQITSEENIRYEVVAASSGDEFERSKLETARSTLTVSLTDHEKENGAEYRCEASNEAVFGMPMSTQVTLSILFPPGAPQISGYDLQPVKVNQEVKLRCTSRGGNPLGTVTWYRNNQAVDHSHTSGRDKAINDYIFNVTARDNRAVYRCEVTNLVQARPLTEEYSLTVHFPPSEVTMSGADRVVTANHRITLTCMTSNSNPRASVIWVARENILSGASETFRESPSGGYITTSIVSFMATESDHNTKVTCRASNSEFSNRVSDQATLNVLYPPKRPKINNYQSGHSIRAGDLKRIMCSSTGGNPPAQLHWYKGDQIIEDAVYSSSNTTVNTYATSEMSIVAQASDNGARYTCQATNTATSSPLVVSITLSVHFPPESVSITQLPVQPRVGQLVNLTCTSSSSNPAADIKWLRNGRHNSGISLGSRRSTNGGSETTNSLRFYPTAKDHNAVYSCQATNTRLDQSVTDAVTLNVLFKPEFNEATLPVRVEATKGKSIVINLRAAANPPEVSYRLDKSGKFLTLPARFSLGDGLLNISRVSVSDAGNYSIRGENSQGSSVFNFSINVKYPASIEDITGTVVQDEGDTAHLRCVVDANPLLPSDGPVVTWLRPGFDMTRARTDVEGATSSLVLPGVTRDDAGVFKCRADNGIGEAVTRTAKLVVRFKPTIDKSASLSRSAGEKGSTVSLRCRSRGAPTISFTWTRNNRRVSQSGSKHKLKSSKCGEACQESTLMIGDLTADDYGNYTCTATNSKGHDSHIVLLTGTSKPFPPSNLTVNATTANSITLSWLPSFNGGLPQSFRIRYKKADAARGYQFQDVNPFGANTYKITGLELGTVYEFTVMSFNARGESPYIDGLSAKTADTLNLGKGVIINGADEIPVIIILVVCIVGVFILALNVGLILFFIQRRKKRLEGCNSDTPTHTNTFELYGTTKIDHLGPPGSDDLRSYGTYDKNDMDDFSDDYIRDYEPAALSHTTYQAFVGNRNLLPKVNNFDRGEDQGGKPSETHVFLPPQSDYPPESRPYSPHLPDSPGRPHKMTYLLEDQPPGRLSPWNDDPGYKVSLPRHKNYENGVHNGDVYEFKSSRAKNLNELSEPSSSRPSSRSGKPAPPPPTRCASQVPSRNYDPPETVRYGPTPGSSILSPNIVANPNYKGPNNGPNNGPPHELRGHLV